MRVRLKKSPRIDKKFRVTFENGKIVDFGATRLLRLYDTQKPFAYAFIRNATRWVCSSYGSKTNRP